MADSTISTMSDILKNVYAEQAPHQINIEAGPFYEKIGKTMENIYDGEQIRVRAPYGLMGGFSSPSADSSALPTATEPKGVQLESSTKQLFSTFRMTEKVIKATKTDKEAFAAAMYENMQMCIKTAAYHSGRQLQGDGTGILGTYASGSGTTSWVLDSVNNIEVGMLIDQIKQADGTQVATGVLVSNVDITTKTVTFNSALTDSGGTGDYISIQSSYGNEMTGLNKVFASTGTYLGVNRTNNKWFTPHLTTLSGAISDSVILNETQKVERYGGSKVDMICCAYNVEKFYYGYLESLKRAPNTMELKGGFSALSFKGIPIVPDKFMADGVMYLLDSTSFKMHHLEPWNWSQEDGSILKWVSGYNMYQGVYALYADLICKHPRANARISSITS